MESNIIIYTWMSTYSPLQRPTTYCCYLTCKMVKLQKRNEIDIQASRHRHFGAIFKSLD